MLQLVLGIAGTGKTRWMLDALSRRAQEGKHSVYLVPEQFSSSAETMVHRHLGDAQSAQVQVLSFRTLAEHILEQFGGITTRVLGDAGRAVYVRRAMETMDGLQTFSRSRRDTAFCNLCADTLSELKTAGASPLQLKAIADAEEDSKLADLAMVFAAYEEAIAGTAMDPTDRLTLAARRVEKSFFAGRACFVDNFDGFTPPEYRLLEPMLAWCEAVYAALCCDGLAESDGAYGRFSPVRATAQRLLSAAREQGVPTKAPLVLQESRRAVTAGPRLVNQLLACGTLDETPPPAPEGLWLTRAADPGEEVRLAAAEMHRLALEEGVPYSRMALVCRDISRYESIARRELGLFDIPFFCDASGSIEFSAPVTFLRGALALLAGGLGSEPVLTLLKSGLCGYDAAEIAALDNYVYTWRPRAADWRKPFENNPSGLMQEMSEADARQLAVAEGLRAALVPPLEKFREEARGKSARVLSRQLYLLMNHFSAVEHSAARAAALEAAGSYEEAEHTRRAWDLAMDLLDQMALLLEDERLDAREYDELFLLLVRSTDFGQAPQSLESVVFTSADRMRLADPDYCFVVGLEEGEFPRQVGYSGLLTHADRDVLVKGGIEMPGSFFNRVLLEDMFFYRALTACRKGLYLSWPARRGTVPCAVSAALEPVQQLQPKVLEMPPEALAATPEAAYDLLGGEYRRNTTLAASLYRALQETGGRWTAALGLLDAVDNPADYVVRDRDALRRLTGDELVVSPTRADRFFSCRFAYYIERILRVRPRSRAALSPMESGTFVHSVLEAVLREAGDDFAGLEDAAVAEMAARHADAFLAQNLPDVDNRTTRVLERVKEATTGLLRYLRDWAKESDFAIEALELNVGEGDIPPLRIEGADGQSLLVQGQIDRVDVLHRGDETYLCVLDYKTGTKEFNLNDVYYGRNIQMLLYMDMLCKQGKARYPEAIPAAMLYIASDPGPVSGRREDGAQQVYHLDGLLLDNPEVVQALDHTVRPGAKGLYLPVQLKKDGTVSNRSGKLKDLESIGRLGNYVEGLLEDMAGLIGCGDFAARPLVDGQGKGPCGYCAYRAICRHEDGRDETVMEKQEADFTLPPAAEGEETP